MKLWRIVKKILPELPKLYCILFRFCLTGLAIIFEQKTPSDSKISQLWYLSALRPIFCQNSLLALLYTNMLSRYSQLRYLPLRALYYPLIVVWSFIRSWPVSSPSGPGTYCLPMPPKECWSTGLRSVLADNNTARDGLHDPSALSPCDLYATLTVWPSGHSRRSNTKYDQKKRRRLWLLPASPSVRRGVRGPWHGPRHRWTRGLKIRNEIERNFPSVGLTPPGGLILSKFRALLIFIPAMAMWISEINYGLKADQNYINSHPPAYF